MFRREKKPNRFYYTETRPYTGWGLLCSVEPTHAGAVGGGWRLTSLVKEATTPQIPLTFMEVLYSWGNTWLWDNILMMGVSDWLQRQYRKAPSLQSRMARTSASNTQIYAPRRLCLNATKDGDA